MAETGDVHNTGTPRDGGAQGYRWPRSLDEALHLLRAGVHVPGGARVMAGGTDVLVEVAHGAPWPGLIVDITAVPGLREVRHEAGHTIYGALVTHNDMIADPESAARHLLLAQACLEVGAPQIRARATLGGNLVTAAPTGNTIVPLIALGADVVLQDAGGARTVALDAFQCGPRRTVMRPDEVLREVRVPVLGPDRRGISLKLARRRGQAKSVLNVALVLRFDSDAGTGVAGPTGARVAEARIVVGCVAPNAVRAQAAETYLRGRSLDAATIERAGDFAAREVDPDDNVRASGAYRRRTLRTLVRDSLALLAAGEEARGWMTPAVRLEVGLAGQATAAGFDGAIETTINGVRHRMAGATRATLLDLLREDAGLTGTKQGCGEGECGACTVWLDGAAVMACITPAPHAHGARITTIEGLAAAPRVHAVRGVADLASNEDARIAGPALGPSLNPDAASPLPRSDLASARRTPGAVPVTARPDASPTADLHPLQRAFIDQGAVQCGYCIPGMLMAGARLLDEADGGLDRARIDAALCGNICRCTGYQRITAAILAAGGDA